MKKLLRELEKMGLSNNEAGVYLATLELGPSTVSEIARKSGVKRTTVYRVISDLKKKNLLTEELRGKKNIVHASGPVVLELLLNEQKDRLNKILPTLNKISSSEKTKSKITLYKGLDEVWAVDENLASLSEIKEILAIYSGNFPKFISEESILNAIQKRTSKNIPARILGVNVDDKELQKYAKDKRNLIESKSLVTKNKFPTNISIYGDSVYINKFKGDSTGILIEDKDTSESFIALFNMLWEKN